MPRRVLAYTIGIMVYVPEDWSPEKVSDMQQVVNDATENEFVDIFHKIHRIDPDIIARLDN